MWYPRYESSCLRSVTLPALVAIPRAVGHSADVSSGTLEKYMCVPQETLFCCPFIHKASKMERELVLTWGTLHY